VTTSKATENVEKIREFIQEDCRLSANNPLAYRHHWDQLWSLPGDCNKNLKMRHISTKFVPQLLTNDEKQWYTNIRLELREKANKGLTFILGS
jgi:hypothetical protein